MMKFDFSHSKLRKQPYFAEISKSRRKTSLPFPLPTSMMYLYGKSHCEQSVRL